MKPLADCRLYTFIDTAYVHGRNPAEVARALCAGGADLIQLRAKDASPDQIRQLAEQILPITETAGVRLVINDHPRIALQIGAPACHLGQEDFFHAGYRTAAQVTGCPPALCLGLSTHSPDQALRALRAQPDYLAVGPVFATPTKPTAPPVTLDYVRWAATHIQIPWFAIGGITLDTLDAVLAAGARRVCIVSAILNAPNITAACQLFQQRLRTAPLPSSTVT